MSCVTPQTAPHTYYYLYAYLIASRPSWFLANGKDAVLVKYVRLGSGYICFFVCLSLNDLVNKEPGQA